MEDFVRKVNGEGECALHYGGRIKKSALHFPKEDAMIMKLLMEHGSDVMSQTSKVRNFILIWLDLKIKA